MKLPQSWKNCEIPDCPNKVCIWANETLCFKCLKRLVGEKEMIRRYNATHDVPWEVVYGVD